MENNHQAIERCNTKFSDKPMMPRIFLAAGIIFTVGCNFAQAQSPPAGAGNTSPNLGNISPGQFNNVRPVPQRSINFNSGGSQQFFRQGDEQLYFLPEEKPEPILEIDETVEAEGINYEDLQNESSDE